MIGINVRKWAWFVVVIILLQTFVLFTGEVRESNATLPGTAPTEFIGRVDQSLLSILALERSPRLNSSALDITALGSSVVLALITAITALISIIVKEYRVAIAVTLNGIGAAGLSLLMKGFFERPRPPLIGRLIEVQGYSYPSGHSLGSAAIYTGLAILSWKFLKTTKQRILLLIIAGFLVLLIGMSRIYLGVHYPSDVIAGILLGTAWALALAGLNAWFPTKASNTEAEL